MKIPCLTIRMEGEDLTVLYYGTDKAQAIETAKAEAEKPHKEFAEYRVIQAIGAGIAWRRTVKASAPVVDEEDTSADAKALREALKAKGVKVPPRIGIDALLKLAIENGVEV